MTIPIEIVLGAVIEETRDIDVAVEKRESFAIYVLTFAENTITIITVIVVVAGIVAGGEMIIGVDVDAGDFKQKLKEAH